MIVALDPEWVPLLSEGMLGEALKVGDDGALDLVQEVASQGFGTVQSNLVDDGIELPTIQFEAAGPSDTDVVPETSCWQVSFSADHDGVTRTGVAFLPDPEEPGDAAESEADHPSAGVQSDGDRASSGNRGSRSDGGSASGGAEEQPDGDVEVSPAAFDELGDENLAGGDGEPSNLELLAEVNLEVRVELGRRELPLADVLKLATGSVVELEKMVGEPLSVYANGRLIAEGEAVVIDEQFGVRITNLASESRREKAFF